MDGGDSKQMNRFRIRLHFHLRAYARDGDGVRDGRDRVHHHHCGDVHVLHGRDDVHARRDHRHHHLLHRALRELLPSRHLNKLFQNQSGLFQ